MQYLIDTEYIRFRIRSSVMHIRWTLCLFFFLFYVPLEAKPRGARIVAGEAFLEENGARTAHHAIIEWDAFSIDEHEFFEFKQPKSSSAVLNRVIGGDGSELLGTLRSNGRVYLINPNGVMIGPNAQILTSGFIASSLDVLDQEFLQEQDLHFEGDAGSVINLGTIRAPSGDVALIGKVVRNEGMIEAPEGSVFLGSGMEVLLQLSGEERMFVRSGARIQDAPEGTSLEQLGQIRALAVELKAGQSPYARAIHCAGKVDALHVMKQGGRVLLRSDGVTAVEGEICAANRCGKGGDVHVLGDEAVLLQGARIDVSGSEGGGTVLIGGDYQGKNSAIPNARITWMDPDTNIAANAGKNGNGGKVILWGDEATVAHGNIQAEGGKLGGDGGFVEISSLGHFVPNAVVSTLAPLGANGLLFLDPCAVTISSSADSGNTYSSGAYTFSGSTATINIANLIANLSTSNVTVDATASGTGTASITVASPITGAGGGTGGTSWTNNSLTLNGGNLVLVSSGSNISWAGTGTLTLNAATGYVEVGASITNTSSSTGFAALNISGSLTSNARAPVILQSNGTISTVGGNITITGTAGATAADGGFDTQGYTISTVDGA